MHFSKAKIIDKIVDYCYLSVRESLEITRRNNNVCQTVNTIFYPAISPKYYQNIPPNRPLRIVNHYIN